MWHMHAGGASNTGGAVLRHYFDDEQIAALTPRLRPDSPAGLDYYPLLRPGAPMTSAPPRFPQFSGSLQWEHQVLG